jgi:hypothetical protein
MRDSVLHRKKFALDVWAKIIVYHVNIHLNYQQIVDVMWTDWQVRISKGTVRAICEYFEVAGSRHVDEKTRQLVRTNEKVVLSLDGARPVAGEPSLWAFTDRLTGRVLRVELLETAANEVLGRILNEIECDFGVPIVAVISDRRESIVLAVERFLPGIRHAFCHLHFLQNAAAPVAARDSHLLTRVRSKVKHLSIIQKTRAGKAAPREGSRDPVSVVLEPLAEELKCAVAARGDRIKIFPGLEAYRNLEHIHKHFLPALDRDLPRALARSRDVVKREIEGILSDFRTLYEETVALSRDYHKLRKILGRHDKTGKQIRREVGKWTYMLQGRLKRRDLPFEPGKIKWQRLSHATPVEWAWKEWVRLVNSHESGLFEAYDDPLIEFTNNAKEQLFRKCKHHFRALYGRRDVARAFQTHGPQFCRLKELDLAEKGIKEVLLASETAFVKAGIHELHAVYATTRRIWRIREKDTGNLEKLLGNLEVLAKDL